MKQRKRLTKSRRKRNGFSAILPILIAVVLVFLAIFLFQKPTVILKEDKVLEIGEKASIKDLVSSVRNGELINADETVQSKIVGTKTLVLLLRTRLGTQIEETITVEFKDSTAPVISSPDILEVPIGCTDADILLLFSATDNSGVSPSQSIDGNYSPEKAGEYTILLIASDPSGNRAEKSVTLKLCDPNATASPEPTDPLDPVDADGNTPFSNGEAGLLRDGIYTTSKGFTMVVKDHMATIDGILIANKSYSLPKTYTAPWMTEETAKAYYVMQADAEATGFSLPIKSAYRSWADQNWIFNDYVRSDTLERALTFSARPGHSEHQTGLGMDILTASSQESRQEEFAVRLAWLNENAYKYGFILRYPDGKSGITGYIFEPWHYRYVGKELAEILYNNGDWITLEEYYGIDSVYRGYDQ